jgi:hypothetical protein
LRRCWAGYWAGASIAHFSRTLIEPKRCTNESNPRKKGGLRLPISVLKIPANWSGIRLAFVLKKFILTASDEWRAEGKRTQGD